MMPGNSRSITNYVFTINDNHNPDTNQFFALFQTYDQRLRNIPIQHLSPYLLVNIHTSPSTMSATRLISMRSRMAAVTVPRSVAIRSISSTARADKSAVDATKDTLKKADRTVSDAAVKGINKGGTLIPR